MVRKTVQEATVKTRKVGEVLKEARLAKKLTLEKISEKTKISVNYLDAIERSEFSLLPGYVYASGFVRTYAKFLGLDVGAVYDMYRDETAADRGRIHFVAREPDRESGLPHKKELLIAAVALLFIYAVWSIFSTSDKGADVQESDTVTEVQKTVAKPKATKAKAVSNTSAGTAVVKKKSLPLQDVNAAAVSASASVSEENSAKVAQSDAVTVADNVKSEERGFTGTEAIDNESEQPVVKNYGASGDTRVVLVATMEVWVQVSDDDKVIFSRILKPGDKYKVPNDNSDLTLRAGNASGLDVFVDGQKRAPLAKRGRIVREAKIDAESLLSRD